MDVEHVEDEERPRVDEERRRQAIPALLPTSSTLSTFSWIVLTLRVAPKLLGFVNFLSRGDPLLFIGNFNPRVLLQVQIIYDLIPNPIGSLSYV